jgi:hypothetical protein
VVALVSPSVSSSSVLLNSYVNTQTKQEVTNDNGNKTATIDTTIYRTVFYQYANGLVSVRNVSGSSQTVDILV